MATVQPEQHGDGTQCARAWRGRDWGALAFLLLVTVLAYWPLVTPDPARRRSYPEGDFYDQFHAFATYEHDRLWAGEIPLWNPFNFGGHPFLADVQAAVFYPPSLAVLLLSGSGSFSPLWLELEAVVHFYLAAVFAYLFVRRLLNVHAAGGVVGLETRPTSQAVIAAGLETCSTGERVSVVGPLIAALAFAFGGYLTGYPSQQLAILETQVWLPVILLLLDVGLLEDRWPYFVGAGLAWGMALLAGHPQSAMYVFYAALLYGIYRSWQFSLRWRRAVLAQLVWVVLGLGLAAVHLLPAYEFMRLSVRSSLSYQELAGGFAVRDLAQFLVPGAYTHWSPMYVGFVPLFLALVGAIGYGCGVSGGRRGRRVDVLFWAILAWVSLVLSLGGKALLYRLFYWVVPGFNLFRSQERAIYVTSFCLAVLAGYGWQWLSSGRTRPSSVRRASRGLLVVGILALAIIAAVWLAGRGRPEFEISAWLKRLALLASLVWALWAWVRWARPTVASLRLPWAGVLILALVLVDLGLVTVPRNLVLGPAEARVYDTSWLSPILGDEDLYRIANEWGLPGNIGSWLRRQDLYGASPLRLQAHKVMADALPHWRLWQLFGVRYVATWEHDLPGPFKGQRVAMQGQEWAKDTVYLFRLAPEFPRAWVVHGEQRVDDEAALAVLADPAFDPFVGVLLEPGAPAGFASDDSPSLPLVEVVSYTPERIVVHAQLAAAGWLMLGEWSYPGWQALVNGQQREAYRAYYGLRAVPLEAGVHTVEFRYRPRSVYLGAAISLVSVVVAVVLMVMLARRRTQDDRRRMTVDGPGRRRVRTGRV